MSFLIINNLPENDVTAIQAIKKITEKNIDYHIVQASTLNIKNCIGCKTCMFKTPGFCCLNDDYKTIEKKLMKYNDVVIISGTALNFLDYRTIRIFERRFPWAVVFCEFRDERIRHIRRYNHQLRIGVLYTGNLNNEMLNEWLDLYTNHGKDISLGAFHIDDVEEMCKCILQ